MEYIYNIHNLVRVTVDPRVKKWVFEQVDFQIGYFKTAEANELKYEISIHPYEDHPGESEGRSSIFYRASFSPRNYLHAGQDYLFVKKEMNGYSIFTDEPVLINLFIQLLLAREGITFVHAAAIAKPEGGVILLPGAGGVGKTAIMGSMVKHEGYKLLGDDLVLLRSNGYALSFPRPFILKEYHASVYQELFNELKLGRKIGLTPRTVLKFLMKNAPFFDAIQKYLKKTKWYYRMATNLPLPDDYLAAVPVVRIFGESSVISEGEIRDVVFLERYNGSDFELFSTEEDRVINRMFSIIHHEWADYLRFFFVFGSTEIDELAMYFRDINTVMKGAIHGKRCRILRIPKDASPDEFYAYFKRMV